MEAYQWIHPAVGLSSLLLLAATAWTKLRRRKYFRLHYGLALATLAMMITTIGLAVYTIIRCDCDDDWPLSLFVHLPLGLLFLVFLLGQATMGVSMLLFGRKPRLFRVHRFNARLLLGLSVPLILLGVTTAVLLLLS